MTQQNSKPLNPNKLPPTSIIQLICQFLSKMPLQVLLAKQIHRPVSLVMEQNWIFLHPQKSGPYDILAASYLLPHKGKLFFPRTKDHNRKPNLTAARKILEKVHKKIRQNFPQATQKLNGYLHPKHGKRLPQLNWRQLPLNLYNENKNKQKYQQQIQNFLQQQQTLPPKNLTTSPQLHHLFQYLWHKTTQFAASNSLNACAFPTSYNNQLEGEYWKLRQSILNGELPLTPIKELPQLPMTTLPIQDIIVPATSLDYWDRYKYAEFDIEHRAKCVADCYITYQKGVELQQYSKLRYAGTQLHPMALHNAAVALQQGQLKPVFRKNKKRKRLVKFNPNQYFCVLGIDLNGLKPETLKSPGPSHIQLLAYTRAYYHMGIDFSVIAFRDEIVPGPTGPTYLHIPIYVKKRKEPVNDYLFAKLGEMVKWARKQKELLTSFHPIHFRTIAKIFQQANEEENYHFFIFHYFSHNARIGGELHPEIIQLSKQNIQIIYQQLQNEMGEEWIQRGKMPPEFDNTSEENQK